MGERREWDEDERVMAVFLGIGLGEGSEAGVMTE
jgi:hypothetical protein